MNTVWKYVLSDEDIVCFEMPIGAQPLSVQVQNNAPCMWVLVDPTEKRTEARYFRHCGTGHPIEQADLNVVFVGTYQLYDGSFVGHVFELLGYENNAQVLP